MHDNKPGALVTFRGHALMADEFHAFVYGLVGFMIGFSDEVSKAIKKEPHYFLGGLVLSVAIGRYLRKHRQ